MFLLSPHFTIAFILTLLFFSSNAVAEVRSITFETGVDYPKAGAQRTGKLIVPDTGKNKVPAVIMVHGTAGPDSRYHYHTKVLTNAGYAVFQMNFKKGIFTGPSDRIGIKPFMPMAGAALRVLREQPEIDAERIAIMGFSFGGALSREVFHKNFTEFQMNGQSGFIAHVAFYPQCRFSLGMFTNREPQMVFGGGKMLVITGSKDSYGDGDYCPKLLEEINAVQEGQMELLILPGADHGFDGNKRVIRFRDPVATGGYANMIPDRDARDKATATYLEFLSTNVDKADISVNSSNKSKPKACKTPSYANLFPDICS